MRVLYITYTGLTENLGRSQILQYLKVLIPKGVEFDVISFEPHARFKERTSLLEKELAGLPIRCHFVDRMDGRPIWRRLAAVLSGMRISLRVAMEGKFAVIHCRNAFAAECALLASRVSRAPVLYDMRGFWGDARVEVGAWRLDTWKGRLIYSLWKWRESVYIRHSALTNCLTEKAKSWIVSKGYKVSEKVVVTPCCVDFSAAELAARRWMGKRKEGFVCVYLGSRGGVYDDNRLYVTFDEVRKERPGARLLLIGDGTIADVVGDAIKAGVDVCASDIEIKTMQHAEVSDALAGADVGLSFCKPGFYAEGVSSTKIGEYLSVGLPVICNEGIGDVAELFQEVGGGLVLPDPETEEGRATVRNFVRSLNGIDKEGMRRRAARVLDTSVALASYSEMYSMLKDGSSSD